MDSHRIADKIENCDNTTPTCNPKKSVVNC